ncbi:MAG TPA: hypothetical protein VE422_23260 [Terriglobia bacterium]|nr:hypothetical protein [Terriglobia bacterium]
MKALTVVTSPMTTFALLTEDERFQVTKSSMNHDTEIVRTKCQRIPLACILSICTGP